MTLALKYLLHICTFEANKQWGKKSEAKGVKFFCLTDNVVSKIWFTSKFLLCMNVKESVTSCLSVTAIVK